MYNWIRQGPLSILNSPLSALLTILYSLPIMYNKIMHTPIAILGAGPAGMIAAVHAGRSGAKVTLIDANPGLGRKLLVTGSGRANLTNQNVNAARYACVDPAWMETLLARFGQADLIRFFESMGLLTYATSDGWCYPISDSAQSVIAAFTSALELAGVRLFLDHHVTTIRKAQTGFLLKFDSAEDLTCEKLLVAAGGKAYPSLGSKGELFPALAALGHTVLPLVPALAPITADMHTYQKIQGVRLDAHVTLYEVGARRAVPLRRGLPRIYRGVPLLLGETTGNLIFTQWGFNGPAVMDLSHLVARRPGAANLHMTMNFLPYNEAQVRELVQFHRRESIPLDVIPGSSLPPKMTAFFMAQAGLSAGATLKQTSSTQLDKLFSLITRLPVQVTGVRDFEYCQVSAGGVPVTEVDPSTMQSRLVPGLYMAGETVDVVGPCGGNNLQFAFSSGAVAGMAMVAST